MKFAALVCLATLVGFLIGLSVGPFPVKAHVNSVTVKQVKEGYNTGAYGGQVVGFSCTTEGCYVAFTD